MLKVLFRQNFTKMYLVACFLLVFHWNAQTVEACAIDQSGQMPICGGLSMSSDTDVVIIEGARSSSPTNILLGPNQHSANKLDIVIGEVERPLTVVLSYYEAAVLNFSGNVDQVEQVIVMGSRRLGWDHVAVVGIGFDKLSFLPVLGRDPKLVTTCSAPPRSCVPGQYFESSEPKLSRIGGFPIDPQRNRIKSAMWINGVHKSTVFIPPVLQTTPEKPQAKEYSDDWRGELERYNAMSGTSVAFAREQVISPTTVTLDSEQPSWAGMMALIESGGIRVAGDYTSDPDLMQFSEAFSEKYRSRFDPEFRFEPRIDFVIPWHFRGKLPRDLQYSDRRPVTFLVTEGRLPKFPGSGDQYRYCIYSERNKLNQPRGGPSDSPEWNRWRVMCKGGSLRANFRYEKAVRLPLLQLAAAQELENTRQWNTKLCRLLDIPEDAEVVVLATENGRTESGVTFNHCGIETSFHATGSGDPTEVFGRGIKQCGAGLVDVHIDREGPVFLFLKGTGAIQWNLSATDRSQISGIATISDRRQTLSGLPQDVPFSHYVFRDKGLPDGCRNGLLNASPLVGGPSIPLFEMMFEQISGRKVGVFINKGLMPDRADQTPEVIKKYTSIVVD